MSKRQRLNAMPTALHLGYSVCYNNAGPTGLEIACSKFIAKTAILTWLTTWLECFSMPQPRKG